MIAKLKNRAITLKRDAYALYIAARDPRVPWYAKFLMGMVLAYAFSPIDLIPDFIPVLGYVDDLIIVPLGIALSLKMVPPQIMVDARKKAEGLLQQEEPISQVGAIVVVVIWLTILAVVIWFFARMFMKKHLSSLT